MVCCKIKSPDSFQFVRIEDHGLAFPCGRIAISLVAIVSAEVGAIGAAPSGTTVLTNASQIRTDYFTRKSE
jgi:hypothetical protein